MSEMACGQMGFTGTSTPAGPRYDLQNVQRRGGAIAEETGGGARIGILALPAPPAFLSQFSETFRQIVALTFNLLSTGRGATFTTPPVAPGRGGEQRKLLDPRPSIFSSLIALTLPRFSSHHFCQRPSPIRLEGAMDQHSFNVVRNHVPD